MGNYDNSAEVGKQIILKFIKERMEDRKISEYQLANLTGINRSTLNRNFSGETEMTLPTILKICVALEIRPCFIPDEKNN